MTVLLSGLQTHVLFLPVLTFSKTTFTHLREIVSLLTSAPSTNQAERKKHLQRRLRHAAYTLYGVSFFLFSRQFRSCLFSAINYNRGNLPSTVWWRFHLWRFYQFRVKLISFSTSPLAASWKCVISGREYYRRSWRFERTRVYDSAYSNGNFFLWVPTYFRHRMTSNE